MTGQLETILARYGQHVTLEKRGSGKKQEVRAFLHPILKKQEQPPVTATPLGSISEQRWTYIGSGQITVTPGDKVQHGEMRLTVQEARGIFLGESLLYYWALLRPEKEAAV